MTCSCYKNEHSNDEVRPKRLIQSHKKSSYWQVRQHTGAIEAILQSCCSENNLPKQSSSNASICLAMPDGVMKTSSKIRYGNETSSRYHRNCLNNKPKPKHKRNTIKKNVTTEFCVDCPCAKKKGGKFKNECYCIRAPNKPKIPGGPECTVPVSEEESHARRCDDSTFDYRPETLQLAKDIIDYIPQSTFLSRMYRENCKKCMCNACVLNAAGSNLKFTERRLNLEEAYHKIAECNRINFDKLSELNCVNIPAINISPESSRASSPTTSRAQSKSVISDDDCCVRRSCSRIIATDEQINAVKSIRKDNYFETHSRSDLPSTSEGTVNNTKDHKCIFKYTIDDRGLLEPLNPDAYGVNRCSICNKAQPEERPDNKNPKEKEKPNKKTNNSKTPKKVSNEAAPKKQSKIKSTKSNNEEAASPKVTKPPKPPKVTQIYFMHQDLRRNDFPKFKERKDVPAAPIVPPYKHREIPLKVCNPSEDKTVQLNINPCIYKNNISKSVPKYMAPANTWALRYQKGCSE